MINITISPEGEIHISQETAGERAVMHDVYTKVESSNPDHVPVGGLGDYKPSDEEVSAHEREKYDPDAVFAVEQDQLQERWFKEGWGNAVAMALVAKDQGNLEEFFGQNVEGYIGQTEHSENVRHINVFNYSHGAGEKPSPSEIPDIDLSGMWEEADFESGQEIVRTAGREYERVPALMPSDVYDGERWLQEFDENGQPTGTALHLLRTWDEAKQEWQQLNADLTGDPQDTPIVRVADDSGEPEMETTIDMDDEGTPGMWHIPNDELDSMMQEEWRRGREVGRFVGLNEKRNITHEAVSKIFALASHDLAVGDSDTGEASESEAFAAFCAMLRRLGFVFTDEG